MTTPDNNQFGLELSEPRIVMTKFGEREVRSVVIPKGTHSDFWNAWNSDKLGMKAKGWMVGKPYKDPDTKDWEITLWSQTMSHADRAKASAASWAADADITVPKPATCPHDYYPFQKAGIAYALEREGTLIGDEMGLGKTIQGIGFANSVNARRILVVAPATLLMNWRIEIMKWQTLNLPVNVIRPENPLYSVEREGWYVINYDIVGRHDDLLKSVEWDLLICDECHYLKTPNAKRTKLLLGNKDGGALKAKRRLMLTGTPILNRPMELWPIISNLDPKRWNNPKNFKYRYCGGWDGQGATNLEELNARLRETVMVRRLKRDVLKELPAKRRQMVAIAVEDEELAALLEEELEMYERREAEMIEVSAAVQRAEAEGDEELYKECVEKLRMIQNVAFEEMSRIRHETALRKVGYVIEHCRQIEPGTKVLVFAHHLDVVDALVEGLQDRGVVSITGRTPNHKRQPIVEAFQNDPAIEFFVGNIKAAGVGLTLTAASHGVFAELDWTPANVTQAEDRMHRIGQTESVLVQHVVLDGSLDAKIAKMLIAKQEIIDAALNDRVEVKIVERPVGPVGLVHEYAGFKYQLVGGRMEPLPGQHEAAGKDKHRMAALETYRAGRDASQTPADEAITLVPDQDPRQSPKDERRARLDAVAGGMTPEQIRGVHEALKVLAAMDYDHARELNAVGFNKYDTVFGCELAAKDYLTPRQAAAGMKMVRKYRKQYSPTLYRTIFGGDDER